MGPSDFPQPPPDGKTIGIRGAVIQDAPAIARIYNEGIEDRLATLETELRTSEERAAWLKARGPRHPAVVATDAIGAVIGWGSLNSFNARPAYYHRADFSCYVSRSHRGKGVGSALLKDLEIRAIALGYHKMVLAAFPQNRAGMRLYQSRGFSTVGIYHEQGLLDGHWVDVILMEKILSS
jgi:L-amino acid N-acyltransferase YncA